MFLILGILYVTGCSRLVAASDAPKISLPEGKLEGFNGKTVKGNAYFAFEGIPYARAPVGSYRFKDPQPAKTWFPNVWKATTSPKCIQYNHFNLKGEDKIVGEEDCLYLNIYTPSLDPEAKLDVLFYIHGGAFMFNYGTQFGPQLILDRNVVYVSFNYRLGPLGFLSTEDDVLPGNLGLKDQIFALKWVKDHIEHFGGNPDSITISGMSAGGSSVQFHHLIPQNKGLFKQGISMSGSVLNPWVLLENPLEKTKKLSKLLGCPTFDSKKIIKCLKRKPARQLVDAVKHFQPWLYNPFSPFAVVTDYAWSKHPVLPDHPYKLLRNGQITDVPWIISFTSAEGLYPAAEFYSNDEYLRDLDTKWNKIMPYILHYNDAIDPVLKDIVSGRIREYYLKNNPVNKDSFPLLVELIGDRLFNADIEKAGRLHSAAIKSPVYSYNFDYRGQNSKSQFTSKSAENLGVSHGDDTCYVLKNAVMDTLTTEDDREITETMLNIFTSFMKTGTPNISYWEPLSKDPNEPWRHLKIAGPTNIEMETKNTLGHRKFWDSLPFRENEKLFNIKDEL